MFEPKNRRRSASFDIAKLSEILGKANFNFFEPRDERGWWTNRGSEGNGTSFYPAAYQGRFHDFVLNDLLNALRADGSTVLKNVQVLGINGIVAIPDGLSKPQAAIKPYFIEMKTGGDPKFTRNQLAVYPLICQGGHATSSDPRISQVGLTPGIPFPPLRVLLVATSGAGQPLDFIDYCELIGMKVP